jgi:multiple sugar transport system substrate-binding protein
MMLSTVGGLPPDVILIWTQATSEWADSGLLQPLDTFMTTSEMAWFKTQTYPVVRKSGWFKGRLYGLVMGFDLWVCYYRPDHFRQAGLDPDHFPGTLEELVEVGAKLHKFRPNGDIERMGFLPSGFQTFTPLFGGGFFNEATGELTLNTPENLRCLTFLADCRKRLGFEKVVGFEAGLGTDDAASWPFIQGSYSIIAEGEWRVEQLRKYAPQIEYRTVPTPPPKGGKKKASFSMTNFLVMPQGAREPRGAWSFIRFWSGLANPQAAAGFYPILGWMPLGPAVTYAPDYQKWLSEVPQYRTFLDVAESNNICITPPVPFQLYLMDQVKKADDAVSRGSQTPAIALQQLEHDVAHERTRRRRLGYAE